VIRVSCWVSPPDHESGLSVRTQQLHSASRSYVFSAQNTKQSPGTADIEVSRSAIHSVDAEVTANVEEGPVRVYLVAPDGAETSAEARPGSPATISGPARGHIDEFWVYFEALDDTASGVSFEVSYTYP
jgi:hypothetical protein